MILKIRIDDRLLHGQVAYSWKSALGYDAIVIVSDSAAKDEMRKTALKLCCPDGVKLATRTVEAGAELLKNPKLKSMKVFVIAPDPETVCRLAPLLEEKPAINVGGMQMHEGKKMFSKA
nr:PTS sugar transporter subunit IIB [Lachnospiraceae bacterium]